nr:MAG TPA: hypothetical protein [Caudoviricetes sp.]
MLYSSSIICKSSRTFGKFLFSSFPPTFKLFIFFII